MDELDEMSSFLTLLITFKCDLIDEMITFWVNIAETTFSQ